MSLATRLAAGVHSLTGSTKAFAVTQAAWRFFANDKITLQLLAQPLLEHARKTAPLACDKYMLAASDWCWMDCNTHVNKKDRIDSGGGLGYDLLCTLGIGDKDGQPLAPLCMELENAQGVHTTRQNTLLKHQSPLDSILPVMDHLAKADLGKPLVHIIDREADSVGHFRQWNSAGHLFLVRANDRLVMHENRQVGLRKLGNELLEKGAFTKARQLRWRNDQDALQHVAQATVTLTKPAKSSKKVGGKRVYTEKPGPPVTLRVVYSRVTDMQGKELAFWMLLTNLPQEVDAATTALWYYWRWRIESAFKLMKEAGLQAEEWLQETGPAILRRLLVAAMACVVVWDLANKQGEQAEKAREFLVRLSGRLMKWEKGKGRKKFTNPALLAGLMVLMPMLHALEQYTIEEIYEMAKIIFPGAGEKNTKDV